LLRNSVSHSNRSERKMDPSLTKLLCFDEIERPDFLLCKGDTEVCPECQKVTFTPGAVQEGELVDTERVHRNFKENLRSWEF
jgi:hypothetical protein